MIKFYTLSQSSDDASVFSLAREIFPHVKNSVATFDFFYSIVRFSEF